MKKLTYEDIINKLDWKQVNLGKSEYTTGNAYEITLSRRNNDKKLTFKFYDNMYNDSNIEDWIQSLMLDRYSFIVCRNLANFLFQFDYDNEERLEDGKRIFKEIVAENRKLTHFFTRTELKVLMEKAVEY